MKLKYFHVSLENRIGPPRAERLRRGGSKTPCDLEKWNTSILPYSIMRPNFSKRKEAIL